MYEFKVAIVMFTAKILGIKIRDLYDAYPYNPYVDTEVEEFFEMRPRNKS